MKREPQSDTLVLKRTGGSSGPGTEHLISVRQKEQQLHGGRPQTVRDLLKAGSHLAELQASPHVGHCSHLSPDAPGTEQTQWPHWHLPRSLHSTPSSDRHDSVLLLQLQYSPVQPLSQ